MKEPTDRQAWPPWSEPDSRGRVDLHVHTTASDGSETPRRLFEMAREMGLKALGFCDHDSLGNIAEGLALAEELGIAFVPGCEIGIAHDPARGLVEIDLVVYGYDPGHDELNDTLRRLREAKNAKLDGQLERLAREGLTIPKEEVLAAAQGETIRRPHIFKVLRRHYPKMTPDLFFPKTDYGGDWYVPKAFELGLEDCVAIAGRAGGLTVLSSPGSYNGRFKRDGTLIDPDVDRLVALCAEAGVRGLETIYSYQCNKPYYQLDGRSINDGELHALIDHYETLAARHGLVPTGGSDFHGESKPQLALAEVAVPYRYFEGLQRALGHS